MTPDLSCGVISLGAVLGLAWLMGLLVARAAGCRLDLFTKLLVGVMLGSLAGLFLAELGKFLPFRVLAVTLVAGGFLGIVLRALAPAEEQARLSRASSACGLVACCALASYLPPFQTFVAGSDSTMYLGAGVHLARSGSLRVRDHISEHLHMFQRNLNFPSVGFLRKGPYIRLAGGLLKRKRDDPEAVPAFFPLAPVWVAFLAWLGGIRAGPLAAPLFESLMVWAVCLFTFEIGGMVPALATGLFLLTNFAVWWYGRFLVSEPLASYFIWAALVMLARWHRGGERDRRLLVLGGSALGLAGFARTEVIPFTIAAAALVLAWRVRPAAGSRRWVAGVVAWAFIAAGVVLHVVTNPTHHQAYFASDLVFARLRLARVVAVTHPGWLVGLLAVAAAASGLFALRLGRKATLYWLRAMAVLGTAGTMSLYLALGGEFSLSRGMLWLVHYLGLPLLLLSAAGVIIFCRGSLVLPPLAVALWLIASLTFMLNPHVALKHPWAIRRFLPEVIPGLLVLGGLTVGMLCRRKIRRVPGLVLGATLAVGAALFQVQPIRMMWGLPLYQDILPKLDELDRQLEPGANVVVESMLADWQVQVPLWLVYGHETIMGHGMGPYWKGINYALTNPLVEKPLYWLTYGGEGYLSPPRVFGLVFDMVADLPLIVGLPRQSQDRPPSSAMLLRTHLKLYKVKRVNGWRPRFKPRHTP